jgi:hypothetical protein
VGSLIKFVMPWIFCLKEQHYRRYTGEK